MLAHPTSGHDVSKSGRGGHMASENATALAVRKEEAVEVVDPASFS